MRGFSQKAYTLVEMIIVVAIIAIILAVAFPSFLKAGEASFEKICINNLKQIDGAMEQWAQDYYIPAGTQPSAGQEDQIYSYIEGGKPACPSKGTYSLQSAGALPQVSCSRESEGHRLFN